MRQVFVILCSVLGLMSGTETLPDSLNASVGGTVMFTTSLAPTETPFAYIIWVFQAVTIVTLNYTNPEYQGRVTLFPSTGSLELRDLALSDAGYYSVNIVPAGGGAPMGGRTTLNVYEPVSKPRITVSSTDLMEFIDTVTLSCSASGSSLSFVWFNGSAEVTPSDRVHITDGSTTVTIDPVLRYDQGSYICKVFSPVSSSTSDPLSLSVSYGPEGVSLKAPPSDGYAEGSVVPLSCSADSRPEAQFKWLLNEVMLPYTGAQIDLVIKKSGSYSCQAFNRKRQRYTTSQPAELTVWKKIENAFVQSSNLPVEGSSVNLTCDASGSIPTREWKFNGIELKPSGNVVFYDEKRVLSFKILTRKDNGKYTCNISNPVSSQSVDYTVKVIYGPENAKISGPMEVQEGTT